MLLAVWLTIGKEFLLIRRDRVGLFMLLVAPIAVIAAAGFSLAKIYGGRTAPRGEYSVAVLDEDHGAIARAILDALAPSSPTCRSFIRPAASTPSRPSASANWRWLE